MFNSEKLNQPRGTATVHSHPAAHGLTYKLSDTTQTAFTLTLGRQVRPRPTIAAKPQSPLSQSASLSASLQSTYENFAETVRQEFIEGSAIHSDLFVANIQITSDTQTLPGYEVSYPIHEALNWSIARFGHQARETLYAALLQNEDSSCWQAKLSRPILDRGKGKPRKYETPVKNGSRAYLPNIPSSIRALIAQRYNVDVPSTGSFWNWIAQNPQIPILYTEGGKKALSLLSLGYVAIALYGVNGGYRAKDALGNPCPAYLMQDVERFTVPDRPIFLAFDQDAKPETNRLVNIALSRFAGLLQKQGAIVSIVRWESEQGKGVDDLIVTAGANAFHSAHATALSLEHWQLYTRLCGRLTHAPDRMVNTSDLTTLDWGTLPDQGIIGFCSPKATAKTKTIGQIIQFERIVALSTHRICLGRNLCRRIGVDWRGDLDKAQGQFISEAGYTLRVGFCVDSFLAIDPERFKGCVLVIDEVGQVLRHLLTSSTCKKDGKLPALLARLRDLIQVARRVLVADADLDSATLHYLVELRGDHQPVYLVRNDHQSGGFPVEFIQSSNVSPAIARLLQVVTAGTKVFITTDSKSASKRLALQLQRLGASVLLINSDTSGGAAEQRFITDPNTFLVDSHYNVVIATPSLSTGVSIECDYFDHVFGLFFGASSTDADMTQGLGRVRSPVPRTVWCAKLGMNFSPVSRSTSSQELKTQLKSRTDWTTSILRANLREDIVNELESYSWDTDPHLKLWSHISAETNFSMLHLRTALLVRLQAEGNQVTIVDLETDPLIQAALQQAKAEIQHLEASAIVRARVLSPLEVQRLESGELRTPEDLLNLQKTHLADFYCLKEHEITIDLVLTDKKGARRAALLALESQLHPEVSQQRDLKGLERQVGWGKGLCAWDIGTASLRSLIRQKLGLTVFLDPTKEWTIDDLRFSADAARRCRGQVKVALNFTSSAVVSDTQIVHQLLAQLGVKVAFRWSRTVSGHEGEKLKVYRLCQQSWAASMAILERRAARRHQTEATGSPPPSNLLYSGGGDPASVNNLANPPEMGRLLPNGAGFSTATTELEVRSVDKTEDRWVVENDEPDD